MVSKTAAMILTIIGGVFYTIGGILVGGILSYGAYLFGTPQTQATAIFGSIAAPGLVTGVIIIIGGVMMHSSKRKVRIVGGILALIMMLIGAINTLGGLIIGLILTLLGSIFGLLYKEPTLQVQQTQSQAPKTS